MKHLKYILSKKQVFYSINEKWFDPFLIKYKNEFNEFFIKLKKQFKYNATARNIILNYMKNKKISKDEQIILKTIVKDTFKMVGLGSIAIPIPGGTALVLLLINMSKRFNIDILPSQFEKDKENKEKIK